MQVESMRCKASHLSGNSLHIPSITENRFQQVICPTMCGLQVQDLAPGTSQGGQEGRIVPAQGPGGQDQQPV